MTSNISTISYLVCFSIVISSHKKIYCNETKIVIVIMIIIINRTRQQLINKKEKSNNKTDAQQMIQKQRKTFVNRLLLFLSLLSMSKNKTLHLSNNDNLEIFLVEIEIRI